MIRIGKADYAGAKHDSLGALSSHTHENFRGGDGFPTSAVMLTNISLVEAQSV